MRSWTLLPAALILSAPVLAHAAPADSQNQAPAGYTAIFNGKDLAGWHGMPHFDPYKLAAMSPEARDKQVAAWTEDAKKHWSVDNGELVNDGYGAYLTSDKEYGDIEFWIDYKTVPKADSGIYLRTTPQVQIWDSTPNGRDKSIGADKGSGGLFNNSNGAPGRDPLKLADKPFGEWNRFHIIQVGARTTVYLNDVLVVDHAIMENYWDRKKSLPARGYIQLQTHGGEIRWRNLFVREIPAGEANAILAKKAAEGYAPVFNGKDLTGWAGAVDNYEVVDGAIRCKAGKGGALYTEKEFADFQARVEFKLPPAGNNGLAIRFPGKGDPAYAGMTELQVLDDGHPKYSKLDPRQSHGSAYGMIAAKRGYLRPVGEWNFEEVTIKGSKIRVELNGTVILDGDLGTVKEYMANSPHPGKELTKGHFGFAGHGDAVEFKNVHVKPLD